jgi:sugar lactone lactonase YvrE
MLSRAGGFDNVAVDVAGNVFVADVENQRIRRISPDGIITTIAGNGTRGFSGDGGPAINAQLAYPSAVAISPQGYLLIADAFNVRIRQVSQDGIITTVAGNGAYIYFAPETDGVLATNSQIGIPTAITMDPEGNLFITESGTYRIRRVSPSGIITTVAGIGLPGFNCTPGGDGGPAIRAQLCDPSGIAFDSGGNVFFADTVADFDGDFRQIVRKVTPNGTITTVAGVNCFDFCPPFDNDDGLATRALLTGALSLAVDATGRLLIADPLNSRIRVVSPNGVRARSQQSNSVISTFAWRSRRDMLASAAPRGPAARRI